MSATLTITARGREFSRTVLVPSGEPGNFPSDAQLIAKFENLVRPTVGDERTAELARAILTLDAGCSVPQLLDLADPGSI
jgi:2-methylcitrate dehydratase PrpD